MNTLTKLIILGMLTERILFYCTIPFLFIVFTRLHRMKSSDIPHQDFSALSELEVTHERIR